MNNNPNNSVKSESWPFQEARKLLGRFQKNPEKNVAIFETGYGPSGLPHIGTFGEVVRTSMVRQAFENLSGIKSRLIAFSDDMDGLRKVPDNIPNPDSIALHLGKPLTSIPDPYNKYESFGHHNNAMFRNFLDELEIQYEFHSATSMYTKGKFDEGLLKIFENYDEIISIIAPTLGEERRISYSPFLPICPDTGKVLQVPILERKLENRSIVYRNENNKLVETLVTGGNCKLQWKADWAMRWAILDVDYEMSGKDLIDSVRLSSKICRTIGSTPPETFIYELFLDENGEKISKSRGNGLTLEEWITYGSPESLKLYMYNAPRKAKRLHFDMIPKAADDYITYFNKYFDQTISDKKNNPVWFIHKGNLIKEDIPVSFSMLLNLAGVANTDDRLVLWGFLKRYADNISPENNPALDVMVGNAISYYKDFILPNKRYRSATEFEVAALESLIKELESLPSDALDELIQSKVYAVGKEHGYENLREWFQALYEVLFGQSQGPRMGSFIQLFGIHETIKLIQKALDGKIGN